MFLNQLDTPVRLMCTNDKIVTLDNYGTGYGYLRIHDIKNKKLLSSIPRVDKLLGVNEKSNRLIYRTDDKYVTSFDLNSMNIIRKVLVPTDGSCRYNNGKISIYDNNGNTSIYSEELLLISKIIGGMNDDGMYLTGNFAYTGSYSNIKSYSNDKYDILPNMYADIIASKDNNIFAWSSSMGILYKIVNDGNTFKLVWSKEIKQLKVVDDVAISSSGVSINDLCIYLPAYSKSNLSYIVDVNNGETIFSGNNNIYDVYIFGKNDGIVSFNSGFTSAYLNIAKCKIPKIFENTGFLAR